MWQCWDVYLYLLLRFGEKALKRRKYFCYVKTTSFVPLKATIGNDGPKIVGGGSGFFLFLDSWAHFCRPLFFSNKDCFVCSFKNSLLPLDSSPQNKRANRTKKMFQTVPPTPVQWSRRPRSLASRRRQAYSLLGGSVTWTANIQFWVWGCGGLSSPKITRSQWGLADENLGAFVCMLWEDKKGRNGEDWESVGRFAIVLQFSPLRLFSFWHQLIRVSVPGKFL